MNRWTEHDVPVKDGTWRVRTRGSGSAVLFIHGGLVNGHLWDGVVESIGGAIHAIVPDLPLGAHDRPMNADADMSFAAHSDRLVEVLDHLGVDEAIVVANDTGGVAAQYFLVEHGKRATAAMLANIDCYDNFLPKLFFWFPAVMQVPGATWLVAQVLRTRLGRRLPFTLGLLVRPLNSEEASLVIGPMWSNADTRRDLKRWSKTLSNKQTLALAERFDSYHGPVHVAWTVKDSVFPPRYGDRLAEDFPGGVRVEPISDSRSLSPLDQPDQVADRLRDLVETTGERIG